MDTTALILSDGIESVLEQAEGLSLEELRELVRRKADEQMVSPEVRAAWAALDEGRAR